MGLDHSVPHDERRVDPPVFVRLGGNAISPLTNDELIASATTSASLSCFRAVNGDWYKRVLVSSTVPTSPNQASKLRVVTARHLFVGPQPPSLEKALVLPISGPRLNESQQKSEDEREQARINQIMEVLRARANDRIHFDVGDVLSVPSSSTRYVVVDVEPEGGGILGQGSQLFASGQAIPLTLKCRFAPCFGVASDLDRNRFRHFLERTAGELLISRERPVLDEFNRTWIPVDIESSRYSPSSSSRGFEMPEMTRSPARGHEPMNNDPAFSILSANAMVSIGWHPETPVATMCQHCFRGVTLPSPDFGGFAFACPYCSFLVFNPNYPVWTETDHASATPARQLLLRLRSAMSDIHRADPRTIILDSLVNRLPRQLDGSLDWRTLDDVAVRVLAGSSTRVDATPEDVLSRLPLSKYKRNTRKEEERCEICLEQYIENVSVRTLPCFHMFHEECSNDWLRISKACPLCKTPVDVVAPDDVGEFPFVVPNGRY